MLATKLKRRFYLVSVTKFTNLSGNQVPLVLLHVNSVNIILKRSTKYTRLKQLKIKDGWRNKNNIKMSLPLPFSPFFSFAAGSPHPVKVR